MVAELGRSCRRVAGDKQSCPVDDAFARNAGSVCSICAISGVYTSAWNKSRLYRKYSPVKSAPLRNAMLK
jgi:hypothetical protein